MYFKISECLDTHCTCILGDLAVLKSASQGPKSGHRGVGEAALGSVGGSGRPNCLLDATRQQNENAQARAQAVISEIAGGRLPALLLHSGGRIDIALHYGEQTK